MANGHAADDFITPKQIVAKLGVNYQSFLRKLRRGEGPKFKRYGNRIKIRYDWYTAWSERDDSKQRRK